MSSNGRWEWINGRVVIRCRERVWNGTLYQVLESREMFGNIVPYGDEDEIRQEETTSPGGAGEEYSGDDEHLYLCWYYLYSDGSRSPYYACDQIR